MEKNSPTKSSLSLIELNQVDVVSARDSSVTQLEGVDWRINAGEFWIVGGAQASGKTDLIATASALQRPLRGEVRLFGRDTAELKEAEFLEQRMRIGLVFKNGGRMFAHLTVAENIALPLRYHRDWNLAGAEEPVQKLLELTGLVSYAHNTAGMLNANWQQRVGLARALALQPEILFLDEPLTGLTPRHRTWWLDFLARFSAPAPPANSPTTLVLTTNDWQPWLDLGRQFAVLKNKRWLALGGRAELKSDTAILSDEMAAQD